MMGEAAPQRRRLVPPAARWLPAFLVALSIALAACGTQRAVAVPTPTVAAATATIAPTATPPEPTATPAVTPTVAPAATETPALPTAQPTAQSTPQPSPIAPAPTGTPVAEPARLKIPAINVNALVEQVGLTPDGAMDVPKKWEDVGWYSLGARPGEAGSAVIDGHLDSDVAPAVFWRLGQLKPGDHVYVLRSDNTQLDFVVQRRKSYAYNDASALPVIFGAATTSNLNLITCDGAWDRFTKNYSNRLVVFATLAAA